MQRRPRTVTLRLARIATGAPGRLIDPNGWLRLPEASGADVAVKPAAYLPVYEELLGPLRGQAFSLLELGVWKGDSLAMWQDAFPLATIVGIDLAPPELELGPRVHVVCGDQSDADLLANVRAEYAPNGFEVIIDDASHIGRLSARSLQALYADDLRSGGLYIIEDWGTGCLTAWADGVAPSSVVGTKELDRSPDSPTDGREMERRLPSHDAGMVGLVKRLVGHTAAGTLRVPQPDWIGELLQIEWMRVQDGVVILKKAAAA